MKCCSRFVYSTPLSEIARIVVLKDRMRIGGLMCALTVGDNLLPELFRSVNRLYTQACLYNHPGGGMNYSSDDKLMSANISSTKADSEIYWNPFITITHSVSILIQ